MTIFGFTLALSAAEKNARFDPHDWIAEQMPGGAVHVRPDAIEIDDANGCTVWYRAKLTAPLEITYTITVVARGGPHDRVSDVNCFFLATDPHAPDGCPFAPGHTRSGRFSDYDSLVLYYVGMGGNENTTTRFRRYNATADRPLLPEHDRREPAVLLTPNATYRMRIVVREGTAEYFRDGEKIFSFRDPAPLTTGWFAFRTIKSHLVVRDFHVRTAKAR